SPDQAHESWSLLFLLRENSSERPPTPRRFSSSGPPQRPASWVANPTDRAALNSRLPRRRSPATQTKGQGDPDCALDQFLATFRSFRRALATVGRPSDGTRPDST